jgi:hypothetical protein
MIETLENWALTFGPALLIGVAVAYVVRRWFPLHVVWVILIGAIVAGILGLPIKTHAVKLDMPAPSSR